jgi:hypothetical protein
MQQIGTNVTYSIQDGKLIIEVDLDQRGTPSKSGKTLVIASTRGNKTLTDDNGEDVGVLGLNIYRHK